MKQFKAEWQKELRTDWHENPIETLSVEKTIDHLITQHNALCDYLEEREGEKDLEQRASLLKNATYTSDEGWHITLPKPEWWDMGHTFYTERNGYLDALFDASKASGILFKLED